MDEAILDEDEVELATLSFGAIPVQEGVSETWKGTIYTNSGPTTAFVKILQTQQLVSEVSCSLLGRSIGLNIPKGFLVKVDQTVLPNSKKWVAGTTSCLGFGSEDAGHPSFKRFVTNPSPKVKNILLAWDGYKRTALFDEWVANGDRHLGNILYDGNKTFWLIDHSHALTGPNWSSGDLTPDAKVPNQLIDAVLNGLSLEERKSWLEVAKEEASEYQGLALATLPNQAKMELFSEPDHPQTVLNFFTERAKNFIVLARDRIGLPNLFP